MIRITDKPSILIEVDHDKFEFVVSYYNVRESYLSVDETLRHVRAQLQRMRFDKEEK